MGLLYRYFANRIDEDAFGPMRRKGPCRTRKGWRLKLGHADEIKNRSRSNPPENTLYVSMRSPWVQPLLKECRPSHRRRALFQSRWKPLKSVREYGLIRSKQSASAARFGEKTGRYWNSKVMEVPLIHFIFLFYWVMIGMDARANNNHIQGAGIGC